MPSIYHLNAPPHPFWDFVANIEDHPMFTGRPPNYPSHENVPGEQQQTAQPEQAPAEQTEKSADKQPTVEDETPQAGARGIGENNKEKPEEKAAEGEREMPFRGRGHCGRGEEGGACRRGGGFGPRHHRGGCHGGPPPGFGAHFGPHRHGPPMGPWWARRGPPPPGHGPPHHHHGPHGPRSGSRSPGRHGRPGGGPGGFNLGEFLNNLGNRLGVDLSGAAEGLGLDRFNAGKDNNDADFTPRADVFDAPTNYIIHVSLPGAKKEDLGVDWDGENSILRIAGVVYRPGTDEELLKHLAVDGRKREVGVFEKSIRLGTKRDPASIDVAAINAKMTDGVLVVKVPKIEVEHKKRDVPISGSGSPSPVRDMEKATLIDTDEMYDATPAPVSAAAQEKEAEHQREIEMEDNRSETMEFEQEEKLPEYEAEHEGTGSEDEGEYVKINVD